MDFPPALRSTVSPPPGEADSARLKGQVQSIDRELEVDEEAPMEPGGLHTWQHRRERARVCNCLLFTAKEQLFLDRCDAGLFTLQQARCVD